MPTNGAPLRLGVLLSGGGSTLANLIDRIRDGRLRGIELVATISSRSDVRGVEIARSAGLAPAVIRPRDFSSPAAFSAAIANHLTTQQVELVVMAGFLSRWDYPPAFEGRIVNIHPALLPRHGGKGMFGHYVHEAVIAAGDSESGCTVHLVDHEYDHGAILAHSRVPVLPNDTPDTLATRVMAAERELYPSVLQKIADDRRLPIDRQAFSDWSPPR